MRAVIALCSRPIVWLLKPVRLLAWTTGSSLLRGILLEVLTVIDTLMVVGNIQNGALLLNQEAFGGGNFLFGKSVMVIDHAATASALVQPQLRGSLFMGLPIVAFAPAALMTNAAPTAVSRPARGVLRDHMEAHTFNETVRAPQMHALRERAGPLLEEWKRDPKRDTLWSVRGTVTRMLTLLIADVELSKEEADRITAIYIRRFAEYSAFAYFAPFVLGLLGTDEGTRRDVYLAMSKHGVDALKTDMILFAGMFSVGTITMRCVQHAREFDINYHALSARERMAFVVESFRVWPTVSTAHRIVEVPEDVVVAGRTITVQPGQEIAYPFVCSNRDPKVFSDPQRFRLDRPMEEVAEILSWSRGKHVCPAKDLSILCTVLMLDTLAEAVPDLRRHSFSNVEF